MSHSYVKLNTSDEIDYDLLESKNKYKQEFMTPYDGLFLKKIIQRGTQYYLDNLVDAYENGDNFCKGKVKGTNVYNCKIYFNQDKTISNMTCDCPFFQENNTNCKHLYALLLKYCDSNQTTGFIRKENLQFNLRKEYLENQKSYQQELNKIIIKINNVIVASQRYYRKNRSSQAIINIYSEILEYRNLLKKYQNMPLMQINRRVINEANEYYLEVKNLYSSLLRCSSQVQKQKRVQYVNDLNKKIDERRIKDKMLKEEEFDRQLREDWGLLDYEIEEVKKGNYEPWEFEEEDLDEDDYYYDN